MRHSIFSISIYALLCLAPAPLMAQKKQFTIAEATNGMATTLAPENIKNASWQPGTSRLWRSVKEGGADVWKVTDFSVSAGSNPYTIPQGKYPVSVKGIPPIKWLDSKNAWFTTGSNVVTGHLENDTWTWTLAAELPENADNIFVHKSLAIAYTVDNNLYLQEQLTRRKVAITQEANKNIISGKAVHRDEFGIDRGIFFSPNGNYVAYYRMDQTMVNDYPIINWSKTPATVDLIKYPMAGGTSHQVTLHIYNVHTGADVTLKTGTEHPDHYLTAVTWSPDEQYVYIGLLNRDQNHLWLNQYDIASGEKVKTLFEETNAKYVHPTNPLSFLPGSNTEFIWQSERDGYNHLYLYNTTGKLIRRLTHGAWVVNDISGFDMATREVIITASKESPLEKHIYAAGLDKNSLRLIDKASGYHTALTSENGAYVLDAYSNGITPRVVAVRSTTGAEEKELVHAADPLAGYDRPEVRNVTLKAADGVTTLYGKLILPANFNPQKKYPVIVYLYNGPNVQLLHNSFPATGNLWYEYMAQRGYIVFTMDGRGSWNRGLKFEQATFRHLGDVEMDDQLKGVEYLKSLPYVDAKRMGVHGWSFGGFMTTSLMLRHPGVFTCAVAGGPVIDWKMYEVMYTERYMDTPDDNPKGYENANLLTKVKNLEGNLMLIHGTNDDVVVWQHSINFVKKCVDEGVQLDYFVYPGHLHNVRGKDRVHLMQKITDYFDAHLQPGH